MKNLVAVFLIISSLFFIIRCDQRPLLEWAQYGRFDLDYAIHMYAIGPVNGDLGGRSGADYQCRTWLPVVAPHLIPYVDKVRAFLTVDAIDEIRSMPIAYGVPITVPVIGPTGVTIGQNWFDLLDSSLVPLTGLHDAAVVPLNTTYWSGSGPIGDLVAGQVCQGWTSSNNADLGAAGDSAVSGGVWINGLAAACDTPRYVLCIAW